MTSLWPVEIPQDQSQATQEPQEVEDQLELDEEEEEEEEEEEDDFVDDLRSEGPEQKEERRLLQERLKQAQQELEYCNKQREQEAQKEKGEQIEARPKSEHQCTVDVLSTCYLWNVWQPDHCLARSWHRVPLHLHKHLLHPWSAYEGPVFPPLPRTCPTSALAMMTTRQWDLLQQSLSRNCPRTARGCYC